MSKKNAKTYEAMILSLLKFGKHTLLLEVLDVMKRNDMKGTVFLYNELIQHAEQLCPTDPWSYAEDVVKLHMNTNPIVQPNVGTFRSLLKVRAKHSSSPFEDVMRIIREMVNLGMEPSFGCYTQVLMAAERERKGLVAVHVVVNRLLSVKKSLSPEDSTDYDFFAMAMTSVRLSLLNSLQILFVHILLISDVQQCFSRLDIFEMVRLPGNFLDYPKEATFDNFG
ncbi:pentatricopeptide repeat domain-containing protein 3, mitochondrial-like [Xenia sp. Carnegie-2017]|uniref:pentatricopeptide repeat domain-containing protein 3, mitochondrial-like n=1 Tax=Xenia sp. Carnegie-2017 TaxID=2897299 RepID=UPI001F045929|nr:pentatricopeptide repeat domain-containing protein 3, mitochondrial-like [Xenia sp. Carnegie-2017]